MHLFLGVDGGQSGTTALIGDADGHILGRGEAGPCNHAAAGEGRAKLERAILASLAAASLHAGLDAAKLRFKSACFGMSGGPDDKRDILAAILHTERLIVTDDAVIALAGATSTGQGIITIAGTGSIAFGRNPDGRTSRAGGWGYIFGDEGAGFDLARQATRACLRMEEGWGPPTLLRDRMLAATESSNANEMLHRFYTDAWPRSRVASLARLVDATAADSDPIAIELLRTAAQQLAMLAGAVRNELWSQGAPVEVAYVGGVFESRLLLETFRTLVELPDGVRCRPPMYGPAEGALLEAYRAAGIQSRKIV
jgi:N-acetylglucosamine kinase-like BadF-type ATPase